MHTGLHLATRISTLNPLSPKQSVALSPESESQVGTGHRDLRFSYHRKDKSPRKKRAVSTKIKSRSRHCQGQKDGKDKFVHLKHPCTCGRKCTCKNRPRSLPQVQTVSLINDHSNDIIYSSVPTTARSDQGGMVKSYIKDMLQEDRLQQQWEHRLFLSCNVVQGRSSGSFRYRTVPCSRYSMAFNDNRAIKEIAQCNSPHTPWPLSQQYWMNRARAWMKHKQFDKKGRVPPSSPVC